MLRFGSRTVSASNIRTVVLNAVFVAILASLACVPIPSVTPLSPHLAGELRSVAGMPIVGAPVALITQIGDTACSQPALTTATDSAGLFSFAGRESHSRVTPLFIDSPRRDYTVCVRSNRGWQAIYHSWMKSNSPAPYDSILCKEAATASWDRPFQCTRHT
jgi:hypothetical protein